MNQTATDALLTKIAQQHLGIDTLVVQNRDCLDFHDVGVSGLRQALQAAFEAGRQAKVVTTGSAA